MLDIRKIREQPLVVEQALRSKDPSVTLQPILDQDRSLREMIFEVETLKSKRNNLSKEVAEAKQRKEVDPPCLQELATLSEAIKTLDQKRKVAEYQLKELLSSLPNIPDSDIKVSSDPKDNVVVKEVGERPTFAFTPKNHLQLSERLRLFDFTSSAKITGANWPLYRGVGAEIEWALLQLMVDTHLENGFEFILPPLLVQEAMMYGAGQFPKFKTQAFKLDDENFPFYLVPTAEMALSGLHRDETLDYSMLPKKYFAYTPCFRREAGGYGERERGLIRMHQFNKVEMFAFTLPEESPAMFDLFVVQAEKILQKLELHYRNCLLVTGDQSFQAQRTIDIEVYLPGQSGDKRYYEVSSISNCGDFQARRLNMQYVKGKEKGLLHTLNGSGLATSRLMVALLENFQTADGDIYVPQALRPYLRGRALIQP